MQTKYTTIQRCWPNRTTRNAVSWSREQL